MTNAVKTLEDPGAPTKLSSYAQRLHTFLLHCAGQPPEALEVFGGVEALGQALEDLEAMCRAENALADANVRNADLLTEIEEKNDALEQAKLEAESATRAKSAFLAAISHELRTPLTGVLGIAEILSGGKLDPDQRELVDTLVNSGRGLLELVGNVLDLSEIEAGAVEVKPADVEIENLLRETVATFQAAAQIKGLHFRFTVSRSDIRRVKIDPRRLRQIVANLVANAIKFTDHGRIEVVLRIASSPDRREPVAIVVEVHDTGMGIPTERLDLIKEAFELGDSSTTRRFGGLGIGLSLSHRYTQLLGGDLHIESVVGQGTRVYVTLDAEPVLDPVEEAKAKLAASLRPLNILVVDDTAVNRMVISRLLERDGHTVTTANDGRDAVAAVGELDFDFVFMDCAMPVMDGMDATEAILAFAPELPIVALTAEAFTDTRDRALAAGMRRVLTKPARIEHLRQALADFVPNAIVSRSA